jgi:uracil-DNA glycosylase
MIREAPARVETMLANAPTIAAKRAPHKALERAANSKPASLKALNDIISKSEPFVIGGTRAVLGEGPLNPKIAFVGEQPGDQEDREGHPFVGPAGQLLDRAMTEADIKRDQCYVTNAVKHFKFRERGKRRIHESPTRSEIKHYRWWLNEELRLVRPRLIVALGASAAYALADRAISVTRERGPCEFTSGPGFVTIHPSFLLRSPVAQASQDEFRKFVTDLREARALAAQYHEQRPRSG